MTNKGKRELLKAVRPRYLKADKAQKGRILDEFSAATGYHRKYAIHLLVHGPPGHSKKKLGRRLIYGPDVIAALVQVWEISGHLCGKRLHPFLPELVETLERHGELRLGPETREKLLRMSISTIDRRLKRARVGTGSRGRTTTQPGTLLKHSVPIRTFADWNEQRPGFLEIDLVAHCGETTAGEYLHTLCAVDIETRWTEPVALPNKGHTVPVSFREKATFEGILILRQRLPFPVQGIDSDSGAEFINHHLVRYCRQEHITFTRSRPFKKNDQAHVEQKNWTVVRQIIGYARYESPEALKLLTSIYEDLRLFVNFFQPVMKLTHKARVGSKVRKTYDTAQTPYQRILASNDIDQAVKDQLKEIYLSLNPVELKLRIDSRLSELWRISR